MQLEVTFPSAALAPAWQSRHFSIVGMAMSEARFERATSWHCAQRDCACALWSNCAFGIQRVVMRIGATSQPVAERLTAWHVLHTRTVNISSDTRFALRL